MNHASLMIPIAVLSMLACAASTTASMPFVRVQGGQFVDDTGQPITLRGVNLGNWLLLETWMFGLDESQFPDQRSVLDLFEQRFGAEESERLLDLHRAGWMTQRDFDQIAALGFNSVRVPLWHGLFEADDNPFILREDAWEWTDRALEMAEQAGVYVLFDMHGAPGGQSLDQPSGDKSQNDLWNDPVAQERLAWLWQHFARRYKNSPAFMGYDLLNEPYGDFSTDHRQDLIDIMDRVIRVVREIDPDRPILIPGALEGVAFYGNPADRGWTGVGLTEHFYPGIFDGNEQSLGTHARFWAGEMAAKKSIAQTIEAPYVIGEFNPIWNGAGAPRMTGTYYDESAALGWGCFVWCYKLMSANGGVTSNNWPVITNADPWTLGDLNTVSKATIEARFAELATMSLAVDQPLADVLTGAALSSTLPGTVEYVGEPPSGAVPGWTTAAIGTDVDAGVGDVAGLSGVLHSPGRDIFNQRDEFGFVLQAVNGNFGASVTLTQFETFRRFPKVGLMARASLEPDAPHIFVHAFRDGSVMVAWRSTAGGSTNQTYVRTSGFPVGLALGRQNNSWIVRVTDADGQWQLVPVPGAPSLPSTLFVGLASNSGVYESLSPAAFETLQMLPAPIVPPPITIPSGSNLAANASFEVAGSGSSAADWTFLGQQVTRESGWTPVRSGTSLMAYRHWQVSGSGSSSAIQTVAGLTPGARHELSVYVNADSVPGNKANAERIEMRIETTGANPAVLETREWRVEDMETGSGWSRLVLPFHPTGSSVNVRILMYPEPDPSRRDGAVKFDDLEVQQID
ncbi:MAG: cellulase family glycosylhydrolase [Planctomycetota bacterium]